MKLHTERVHILFWLSVGSFLLRALRFCFFVYWTSKDYLYFSSDKCMTRNEEFLVDNKFADQLLLFLFLFLECSSRLQSQKSHFFLCMQRRRRDEHAKQAKKIARWTTNSREDLFCIESISFFFDEGNQRKNSRRQRRQSNDDAKQTNQYNMMMIIIMNE